MAKAYGASMVGSSYNEPLITAEWAVDVFKQARPEGFRTAFISNGNATPQVLDYLRPWTDCYKIDLKSMGDKNYRQLGGVVDNILETVQMVHDRGFWEEIVTLVIPGFNDSEDELKRAADFIASVSPDIPWHVTAFHQDYHMTENANTTAEQLIRACEIGREAGLRYIYAGNLPGKVGRWENTYCPSCDELLVERHGYLIRAMKVTREGENARHARRAFRASGRKSEPGAVATGFRRWRLDCSAVTRSLPLPVLILSLQLLRRWFHRWHCLHCRRCFHRWHCFHCRRSCRRWRSRSGGRGHCSRFHRRGAAVVEYSQPFAIAVCPNR